MRRGVLVGRERRVAPAGWAALAVVVNAILERIGLWHDAEHRDPGRWISPLRPHALRHTFAFALAESTGKDAYELGRRLGHRSQRCIARYTNPPEEIAASYVEAM